MKVLYERVAGTGVHKDMIKVAVRSPGKKPWARKTDILTYRTFYGVLKETGRELRRREVTHVVMEASGIYTDPVRDALLEVGGFAEVMVVNPAHAKALKGHKTDARDCARLAELLECGLLQGSYLPSRELREARDLTRYRVKTVQARGSEVQRLGKALEPAGIKLGSVATDITGKGPTAMIEALIDGERRGAVMADLARGRARTAAKLADLSMALEGRFTDHHAAMCRLHLDRIRAYDADISDLDLRIGHALAPRQREAGLLKTIPGFGDVAAWTWIAEIGPAPHEWFASAAKLASWAGLAPGNDISAGKRRQSATGGAGTYVKPVLVQAAWAAVKHRGRLQARYAKLVRSFGGPQSAGARKKAIVAIAHTLLKIAYSVLKTGMPYRDPGEDFYTRRQSPQQRQAHLERQLQKLYPGCTVTITISPAPQAPDPAPPPRRAPDAALPHRTPAREHHNRRQTKDPNPLASTTHPRGQGSLPPAWRGTVFVSSCRLGAYWY
jgi:transposase